MESAEQTRYRPVIGQRTMSHDGRLTFGADFNFVSGAVLKFKNAFYYQRTYVATLHFSRLTLL